MDNTLSILFIIFVIWIVLYLILEISIVNKKIKNIEKVFRELDAYFIKRLNVLDKMLDIIKEYNKIEFELLSSNLYDYINDYSEYNLEKRISINEYLNLDIKKVLLVSKAYPVLINNVKYVKLEKHLIRLNKVIIKFCKKYNKAVISYENRQKVFPSNIICLIYRNKEYRVFKVND